MVTDMGKLKKKKEYHLVHNLKKRCIKRKWSSISEDSPQGERDKMAEKMMLTFAESGHPVFRATSPLSRGQLKSKGGGKLSIHYCADLETIKTFAQLFL